MPQNIPDGITREDVLDAIAAYEVIDTSFGHSVFYDVLHEGRRYPPKAILGIAAKRLAGRLLTPEDFTGGLGSKCFRILEDLGFPVVTKPGNLASEVATFVEITKADHDHGGKGWGFGRCLWSPTTNRAGADRYSLMREPKPGDCVLHFYRTRFDGVLDTWLMGQSTVKQHARIVENEPPAPGDWAGMGSYYRIELVDYEAFEEPITISLLLATYEDEIRSDLTTNHPRFYPFTTHGPNISTVQGIYLARCTPQLLIDLCAANRPS